jgi:uncharacterized membrane protein YhhN
MNRRGRIGAPLGAAAVCAAVYYIATATGHGVIGMIAKPIPAGYLALVALSGGRSRYARWMAAGLALSIFGDIFLETGDATFQLGVGSFLLAHLCYIGAFLSVERALRPLHAIPFVIWGAVMFRLVGSHLGPMLVPVLVYTCVLCSMMWRSAATFGAPGAGRFVRGAGLIGALLFGLSDTLIALNRWYTPLPDAQTLIMTVYWSGQLGLALSASAVTECSPNGPTPSSGSESREAARRRSR